ncbi:MAG: ABC transporter permease [Candidatus Eremiobacteraeota bacterium]|nr:ABC transporter permease [Candidatus Eremiobacteraeota bacterium]
MKLPAFFKKETKVKKIKPVREKPAREKPEKKQEEAPPRQRKAFQLAKFTGSIFAIREDVSPFTAFLLSMIPIVLLVIIWTLVTWGPVEQRVISSIIMPSPKEFVQAIPKILTPEKRLGAGILVSLARITGGFLIATALALPLGVLMGSFSKFRAAFAPIMIVGSYIPIPTLVPLTLVWFGMEEKQKVGFLAIATFVFLLPAFVKAISDVDDVFLNTGYTLGANKWHIVSKILFPIALPEIYNSLRLGFGVGFTWIIMAEMIGAESGLGFILKNAQSRGADSSIVYLVLTVIVLIAFLIDKLWELGYRALFRYKEAR